MLPSRSGRHDGDTGASLHLLGRFELVVSGARCHVPKLAQRLAAFLVLHGGHDGRGHVAGVLSPEVDHDHALANLRTALWRLRSVAPDIVGTEGTEILADPDAPVDLRESEALARRILDGTLPIDDAREAPERLAADLLPDWDDEWISFDRERFRSLRVHALERLCERLSAAGAHADAVRCGLLAVQAEPLRESAHRALMRAHVAEDNPARALQHFRELERLLDDELQIGPSRATVEMAIGLLDGADATVRLAGPSVSAER